MDFRALPAVVLLISSVASAAVAQKGAPTFKQADSAIRADFAKHEASAKILEINSGDQMLLPFWVAYEANVSVERSGGRRDSERLGVSFFLVKGKWELDEIEVLGRRQLADVEPPSQEEAQRLLSAAWKPDKCEGYDITAVRLVGGPRFQRDPLSNDAAAAKRQYVYSIEVVATGNGKFRMSDRGQGYVDQTQNLLTWDPKSKTWSVEQQQVRCGGWIKQEAQAEQSGAPAPLGGNAPEGIASANPSDAEVVQAFTQAWAKVRPDFTVSSITVKGKDPHTSGDRKWINYKLSIVATGTDHGSKSMAGKKYLCEPSDFSSVLKWDAAAKLWKVDEGAVKDFNESGCTPKG